MFARVFFFERKERMAKLEQVLFVRFAERNRRGNHFVVHLKRNSLGGSRPFGNETSECGLTRFTFRCPNTVGNFLEWSVPDYGACSTPHDESNVSSLPLFIPPASCIAGGGCWSRQFRSTNLRQFRYLSIAIFARFYRKAFIILFSPCLSRCDFLYTRRIFVPDSTAPWEERSLGADEGLYVVAIDR